MKKSFQYLGIALLSIIVIIYLCFLFVLPNAININKFKPELQKLAKEQANLYINFENAKIITTPLLGIGIKTDDISVKLPDNSLLFSADSFKTRLALPSILVWTVKVSCVELNNPFINLEILNGTNLKVIDLAEEILNKDKERRLEEHGVQVVEQTFITKALSKIRIKVPHITINNYKIIVNDLQTKHYLKLTGEQLKAGYFNGKVVKVKTYAEIFSDENKNITAHVNINSFLPPPTPALDEEDDPAERIDIPFTNPVELYRRYDLKADIDTKLKIRNSKHNIQTYGYFNVDNLSLKIGNILLPKSYFRAKTHGRNVNLDTNIYVTPTGNLTMFGKIKYGKHPAMDITVKTAEIKFNDIYLLAKVLLDSLYIPHELDRYILTGSMMLDGKIKTNLKTLKSNGNFIIKNGCIMVSNIGKVISDANININLDNNTIDIENSHLFINNSKVDIAGKIDEKSIADINISLQKVSLPTLFYAFAPKELRNNYIFRSGDMNLIVKVNGQLKKATSTLTLELGNLNIADKARTFIIKNKLFSATFFADKKNILGKLCNEDFKIDLPQTSSFLRSPIFELELRDNDIEIKEHTMSLNDNSSITYSGQVINYKKPKLFNFIANANFNTNDLIKIIGKEYKSYIHYTGSIPLSLTYSGNMKKQTLFAQFLTNQNNFITPIDISELQNKDISLQTIVDFKGNRIKIKKTGLFERDITVDKNGNENISLNEIAGIDGTIAGKTINLIKITMPKELHGKIYVFPNSKFSVNGKGFIFGQCINPRYRGGITINNMEIPELLLTLKKAELKLRGHRADFNITDLLINNSDIQINSNFNLLPASVFELLKLDVASRYMNIDKVLTVADKAIKYAPQTTGNNSATQENADIPVTIRDGNINFAQIISGNINVKNTNAKISMANNVFYLNNLRTDVFNGNVRGNISTNLISSLINIRLNGTNLDVNKALVDAANMKDTLSGKVDFSAKISLQGSTYEEQMKSLTGNVNFNIKDGQFGPFGKLENMILAENIRNSQFFQTALGGVIERVATIDTTHFSELIGALSFNNGVCHIEPITSLGNVLSLHIFGDFDLLKNYTDMKVRARMAGILSNLLGPINEINPVNLMNNAAGMNYVTAKAFSLFCEVVPQNELDILPSFSNKYTDMGATKFQLVINGDVAKPLTLVKSFKWLSSQKEFDTAKSFVETIPEPIEGSTATTIEELLAEQKALEAEKNTTGYKLKSVVSKEWADESAEKEVLKDTHK